MSPSYDLLLKGIPGGRGGGGGGGDGGQGWAEGW